MTTDLATWLLACVQADRERALAASPGPWHPNAEHDEVVAVDGEPVCDGFALSNNQLRATVDHIVDWDPARVLAECDTKRRIIELHAPVHRRTDIGCLTCSDLRDPCETLRLLALPYVARPGYREEWRL